MAKAEGPILQSIDRIAVRPTGDRSETPLNRGGSIVTYEADVTLQGPLGVADPLLAKALDRIGDRAADGPTEVLDGRRVDAAAPNS